MQCRLRAGGQAERGPGHPGPGINGMVYVRGHRTDYDTWSGTYGCAGWSYAELLPYFRRAEDQQRGESVYHGVGGPLGKAAIDPAYLADQADLDVLVAGVRQAREVAACQPFVGLTAGELAPGDRPRDDRGLWPWVRATSPRSSTRQAAAPWVPRMRRCATPRCGCTATRSSPRPSCRPSRPPSARPDARGATGAGPAPGGYRPVLHRREPVGGPERAAEMGRVDQPQRAAIALTGRAASAGSSRSRPALGPPVETPAPPHDHPRRSRFRRAGARRSWSRR